MTKSLAVFFPQELVPSLFYCVGKAMSFYEVTITSTEFLGPVVNQILFWYSEVLMFVLVAAFALRNMICNAGMRHWHGSKEEQKTSALTAHLKTGRPNEDAR